MRLGVVPDFREENWPSMDHVAERLLHEISAGHCGDVSAEPLCPPFKKRFMRLPALGKRRTAFNADRLLNRMRDYPRHLRKVGGAFDCFHVCDHAYANVVHTLPPERTGVFCHDLDTFHCLFEPAKEPRPHWFKAMMRRVLTGLEKAAVIFHTTAEIRRQILAQDIVEEAKLVQARLGVSNAYSPDDGGADCGNETLKRLGGRPFMLHVGSCIPRKRIDVLLSIMAALSAQHPDLNLVKTGDLLTPEQRALAAQLNLTARLIETGRIDERELAGLYRHAAVVVQPSDAEGFGLPVVEALACGCVVAASSIATLMEVGGDAVTYCPAGDVGAWVGALNRLLRDPLIAPPRETRLSQAAKYSWTTHAQIICDAYRKII